MKLDKFIGISFKDCGRDYDGVDCWGLCKLFYRDFLGIDIPDYGIDPNDIARVSDKMKSEILGKNWVVLNEPEPFCIAVMKLKSKVINHAGILVDNNRLLQAYSKTGSCLVNIKTGIWKRSIAYYVKPSKQER